MRSFGNNLTNRTKEESTTMKRSVVNAPQPPATTITAGSDEENTNHLLLQIWEAKSDIKDLERFVGKWERALSIHQHGSTNNPKPPLVERLSLLLDIMASSRSTSQYDEFNAEMKEASSSSSSTFNAEQYYHPPKMSLTTFATCTPRQFGGQKIGESTTLVARPAWVPDDSRHSCMSCGSEFGIFSNRRHHCRACGGLFDAKCCDQKVRITRLKYDTPVLVCKFCLPEVVQSNQLLSSKPTRGPLWCWNQNGSSSSSSSSSSNLEKRFNVVSSSNQNSFNNQWNGETKENHDSRNMHQREHLKKQEQLQQEKQRNEREKGQRQQQQQQLARQRREEEEEQMRRAVNLRHVERERKAFVQRRKRNASRIDELKYEQRASSSTNNRTSSPCSTNGSESDCGSVIDMQFV
jgi:hypothetical protein